MTNEGIGYIYELVWQEMKKKNKVAVIFGMKSLNAMWRQLDSSCKNFQLLLKY